MELKSLHDRIRVATQTHHSELENTPPFCNLMSENITPDEVKWSLSLFNSFFSDYLNFKVKEAAYFSEKLKSLASFRGNSNSSSFSGLNGLEVLAWDYIFLGSQLGNRMILAKNKMIQRMEEAEYFRVPMPQEIWRQCLAEIGEVQEVVDQNYLVDRVTELFQELRSLALESRR